MPELKENVETQGTPKIGPVATDLLFENDEVKIWQMNRGRGNPSGITITTTITSSSR